MRIEGLITSEPTKLANPRSKQVFFSWICTKTGLGLGWLCEDGPGILPSPNCLLEDDLTTLRAFMRLPYHHPKDPKKRVTSSAMVSYGVGVLGRLCWSATPPLVFLGLALISALALISCSTSSQICWQVRSMSFSMVTSLVSGFWVKGLVLQLWWWYGLRSIPEVLCQSPFECATSWFGFALPWRWSNCTGLHSWPPINSWGGVSHILFDFTWLQRLFGRTWHAPRWQQRSLHSTWTHCLC